MHPAHRSRLIAVVKVPDQLVIGSRQEFKDTLLRHLAVGESVIVDFHDARYLDSAGLGTLLAAHRQFRDAGQHLAVCGLNDDLVQLFHLTRLTTVLPPHADVESARTALAAA